MIMMIRRLATHGQSGEILFAKFRVNDDVVTDYSTHDFGASSVCVCDEPSKLAQSSFGGSKGKVIYCTGLEEQEGVTDTLVRREAATEDVEAEPENEKRPTTHNSRPAIPKGITAAYSPSLSRSTFSKYAT
jgi:hypothetical protein